MAQPEFHKDSTLNELIGKFRKRISGEIIEVDLSEIDPDLEETWYFRPATGTQADAILKKVSDGAFFAAQVEALFQRCYTDEGRKRFRPADRDGLMKLDPEFISQISERIGAFDDLQPDVDELGNSSASAPTSKPSSSSAKGSG